MIFVGGATGPKCLSASNILGEINFHAHFQFAIGFEEVGLNR